MKRQILLRVIGGGLLIGGLLSTENVIAQISWDKPVPVTRVEKPRRTPPKPRPKPKPHKPVVQMAPLLALRWSVQKRDQSKMVKPANPEGTFKVGDYLRLLIEVNQDGYLYIIQEGLLTMIFPDKRIKNGDNRVTKGQKIVIPSNCAKDIEAQDQCWFVMEDKDDDITLIFSRDRIDDLPNSADESGAVTIKKEALMALKSGTSQQFSKTNPDAVTVQFTNLNRKDNEELIIETKIRHQ